MSTATTVTAVHPSGAGPLELDPAVFWVWRQQGWNLVNKADVSRVVDPRLQLTDPAQIVALVGPVAA